MRALALSLLLSLCAAAFAAPPDLPPPYEPPAEKVSGRISIWGHGALAGRFDFIEALVKCGAFDGIDDMGGRQAMLDELEKVMSAAQAAQRAAEVGQVTMFEMMLAGGSGSDVVGNDGSSAV